MLKILWLAPNFNHYKARFLNYLANQKDIKLTILSGTGRQNMGDQELYSKWSFEHIKVNVSKKGFGYSKIVKSNLKKLVVNYDWVMIPAEKKNLLLFLYTLKLRKQNRDVRLFSYNHPILKTKNKHLKFLDLWLTKFFYRKLDRVVFYTKESMQLAIREKLITKKKSFWANNTIDTVEVNKFYNYREPPKECSRILFIGRLIASKQIPELLRYFNELKTNIANIKLEIIGDGPMAFEVEKAISNNQNIIWHQALVDEKLIAPIMSRACFVFVPGHSGLSINHAFAYGRPYITVVSDKHPPEINYLIDGKNGYILGTNFTTNVQKLVDLLKDYNKLNQFCQNAKLKGEDLSIEKWVTQMKHSLSDV
jgi:glycosyltransferase involved in cell wall biosynthesis